MFVRIYAAMCLAVGFIAGVLIVTGNFTMLTSVIFGFIGFGLVFMGMMSVLPATIAHPAPPKEKAPVKLPEPVYANQPMAIEAARSSITAWSYPNGVETRKPGYR